MALEHNRLTIWQWLFSWLLLDTLVLYLLRPFFFFPINALLPVLTIAAYMLETRRRSALNTGVIISMTLIAVGSLMGIALQSMPPWDTTKAFFTAVCAFIIGYKAIAESSDLQPCLKLVSIVGLMYTVICVLALLGVSSTFLPVSYLQGFDDGVLVSRAELTTDQNTQIYYLFPLVLVFVLKQSSMKNMIFLLAFLGTLFINIKMETRSGLLLMTACFSLIVMLPVWYKQKNSVYRLVGLGVVAVVALASNLSLLTESSDVVARRFASDNLGTFWGRIESAMYLYERIWNPLWWLPRGLHVFQDEYHGLFPHHAPTFIFLQAGILGLGGWFYLIALPVFKGMMLIKKRRVDLRGAAILTGALVSFVASLSLGVAMFEQLWLWGGAAHGVLAYNRQRIITAAFAEGGSMPTNVPP